MSHLVFTYDNPADPISITSHETLADAKADAAMRADAITEYLFHSGFDVKVQNLPNRYGVEVTLINARHALHGDFAFSIERKVGVLA